MEKPLMQESVDAVWKEVWQQEKDADHLSVLRNRLFVEGYPVIRSYVPVSSQKILEVGGGTGRYGIVLAKDIPEATIYITDILEDSLEYAQALASKVGVTNVEFKKEDMFSLSFADDSFDVVVCDAVIQHSEKPEGAVREMLRVLKPEGILILTAVNVWNFHTLYKNALPFFGEKYSYGYEKSYSHQELANLVVGQGGEVVGRNGFHAAYGLYRLKYLYSLFDVLGRFVNVCVRALDAISGRFFSKQFGFEIVVIGKKEAK